MIGIGYGDAVIVAQNPIICVWRLSCLGSPRYNVGLSSYWASPVKGNRVRNHDLVFLKHFSQVIAFLVAVTIALILLGIYINGSKAPEISQAKAKQISTAIEPHGAVYAGATGAAAQAAAKKAADDAAKGQVAYGGTLDGSVIFGNLCTGCHSSGAGGAPKLEKGPWSARIAQGKDTLHKHAIEGYHNVGVMPARGGNPSLTDQQVMATVDWMIGNLK
jgi:cytochrome c5